MPLTQVISAKTLRAARSALNWSLAVVSEKTGLTTQTISRIETGRHKPLPANIRKLEIAYTEGGVDFVSENGAFYDRVTDDPKDKKERQKRGSQTI